MREYEPPEAADEPERIEPGRPSLENAVFVLLGVATTLAVLVHVATLLG